MGREDLKNYDLETKENYIIYLKELIILTHKHMMSHKRYIMELNDILEKNNYKEFPTAKIDEIVYEDINDKISNVSNKILNLLGDQTKTAMSYRKFRILAQKRMEKGLELGLQDLSKEIWTRIDEFNNWRNWGLHVPESLLTARLEFMNEEITSGRAEVPPKKIITIAKFDYYEARWLISLQEEAKNAHNCYSQVFQQMKKDYSMLVGESMRIEYVRYDVRPTSDLNIPRVSMKIQQRKYKGIKEDG